MVVGHAQQFSDDKTTCAGKRLHSDTREAHKPKRLPGWAAVKTEGLYLQRISWRISDSRCRVVSAPIKADCVPRRIVAWNDPQVGRKTDTARV